jgi:hypothetical protein
MPCGVSSRRTWWITWKGNEGISVLDRKGMKIVST